MEDMGSGSISAEVALPRRSRDETVGVNEEGLPLW